MAAVGRFGPPLALMAVIFALSAQPDLNSGLGGWDIVLRKLAHMTEFGMLWFLWWRALGYGRPTASIVIVLAYAATDELRRPFVDGRDGTPIDFAIDALGVGIAGLISSRARWP